MVWDDVHDMPDSSEVFACLGILLRFIEKAAPNSSLLVSCTAPSYFARLRGLAPVGFWQSQGFRELDLGRWGGPELARITEHVLSMQRPALSAVTKHVLVQTIVQRVLGARTRGDAQAGPIFAGFIKILPSALWALTKMMYSSWTRLAVTCPRA